jgi:hypothetical protein
MRKVKVLKKAIDLNKVWGVQENTMIWLNNLNKLPKSLCKNTKKSKKKCNNSEQDFNNKYINLDNQMIA